MAVIVPVAIAAAAVLDATPLDRFDRCGSCAWTLKGDIGGQGVALWWRGGTWPVFCVDGMVCSPRTRRLRCCCCCCRGP